MLSQEEKNLIKKEALSPFNKLEKKEGLSSYSFPSCSDSIQIFINPLEEGKYSIHFSAEGCSLSLASTSLMIRETNLKTKSEINNLIEKIKKVLREGTNEELPKSLSFLKKFYEKPNRRQCVELGWIALEDELKKLS